MAEIDAELVAFGDGENGCHRLALGPRSISVLLGLAHRVRIAARVVRSSSPFDLAGLPHPPDGQSPTTSTGGHRYRSHTVAEADAPSAPELSTRHQHSAPFILLAMWPTYQLSGLPSYFLRIAFR